MMEYIIYGVLCTLAGLLMIKYVKPMAKLSWAARHGVDENGVKQVEFSLVILGMLLVIVGVILTIVSIVNY